MKLMRLLGLPWMALSQRWRMGIGVCFALLFVGATAVGVIRRRDTNGVLRTVHAVAGADCLFWAGASSQSLQLAREAHRLRLPALDREVTASLTLYALLTIALPALLLAWLGGNVAVTLTEIGMGAGLGMAYATLPPYLGLIVCFTPMLSDHAGPWLPMPSASPDRFLAWAVPCAVLLWLLIGGFWRSAVRRDFGLSGARKPTRSSL